MKDDISQKIRGNMMFSVYSEKAILPFPTNMKLPHPSVKKAKRIFSPKNTPKYDISGITEKDDTHPEKNDIGIPG